MSKSFKKHSDDAQDSKPFRIVEKTNMKRTFNKDNSYSDAPLEEDKELNGSFTDLPF